MFTPSCEFPFEKSIVLNALYDTLDKLGYHVKHANRERGTINIETEGPAKQIFRLGCDSMQGNKSTVVQIIPATPDKLDEKTSAFLFDELGATLMQCMKHKRI